MFWSGDECIRDVEVILTFFVMEVAHAEPSLLGREIRMSCDLI